MSRHHHCPIRRCRGLLLMCVRERRERLARAGGTVASTRQCHGLEAIGFAAVTLGSLDDVRPDHHASRTALSRVLSRLSTPSAVLLFASTHRFPTSIVSRTAWHRRWSSYPHRVCLKRTAHPAGPGSTPSAGPRILPSDHQVPCMCGAAEGFCAGHLHKRTKAASAGLGALADYPMG
jgi:hypothetical protein